MGKRLVKCPPKATFALAQVSIVVFGAALMALRSLNGQDSSIVVVNAQITSHVSNFAISLVLYSLFGFAALAVDSRRIAIVAFGFLLALANVVCETVLAFVNVPDIADAAYGIAGTALAGLFLIAMGKWGLEKPPVQTADADKTPD